MLQLRARLPSRSKSGHWCERQMQLRACLQPIYGFAEQCSWSFACAFAPCALLVCAWPIRASARQHQVACSWRALAAAEALLRSSLRLWASVPPAGRRPRPQLRLAPCWAPCRPSCRLAAAQSRVLHGASYSGALASGHPRHTLLSSCPGGGSATGLCHHIWCPRCFRVFCRPGARC